MDITNRASLVAKAAHGATGRLCKYTGRPYWLHLAEIANKVKAISDDDMLVAAAWLHDITTHTKLDNIFININFGKDIAALVAETAPQLPFDSTSKNVLHEVDRVSKISDAGKLIVLCGLERAVDKITSDTNLLYINSWLPTQIAMMYAIRVSSKDNHDLANEVIELTKSKINACFPGKEFVFLDAWIEGLERHRKAKEAYLVKKGNTV